MAGKVKSGARRIISLVLVVALCISLLPSGVLAAEMESDTESETTVTVAADDSGAESTVSNEADTVFVSEEVSGTDDVGELLAAELTSSSVNIGSDSNYIIDVEVDIEESTATVRYMIEDASIDAELYVAIYDEGDEVHWNDNEAGDGRDYSANLGCGGMAISSDDNEAVLELSWSGDTPEYFMVYAIIVRNHEGVEYEYYSSLYTQEMQELLGKTTDDFNEDQVLNLDSDKTNNFMVFSEDTIRLYEGADQNVVTDHEDGTYTVTEADEAFISLAVGDVFAYEYLNGDILIVSVGSATVDGTTVTIVEDETQELSDVFDYVKFYSEGSDAQVDYDTSELEDGITCDDAETAEDSTEEDPVVQVAAPGADGVEISTSLLSRTYKLNFLNPGSSDSDDGDDSGEEESGAGYSVQVTGTLSLDLGAKVSLYYTPEYVYTSIAVDYAVGANITASGDFSYTFSLGSPTAYLAGGLSLKITPQVKVNFSAKATADASISGIVGAAYSSENGSCNLTTKPVSEVKSQMEGSVYLGLAMEEMLIYVNEKLASVSVTEEVGIQANMALEDPETAVGGCIHDCAVCYLGNVSAEYNIVFAVSILNGWLSYEYDFERSNKLFDFYYSQTYSEFGKGKCPHQSYLCTIYVTDTKGNSLDSFQLNLYGEWNYNEDTGSYSSASYELTSTEGFAEVFLYNGSYKVLEVYEVLDESKSCLYEGESIVNSAIVVNGEEQVVYVEIAKDDDEDDEDSGSGYFYFENGYGYYYYYYKNGYYYYHYTYYYDDGTCGEEIVVLENAKKEDEEEDESVDINSCVVSLEYSSTTYDGTEKTPEVSVSYGGAALTKGTDYTLEYYDNINAGMACVRVYGIGNYYNSCDTNFTIQKATPTLKLSATSANLNAGETKTLTGTTNSDGKITYTSGKTSVATVGKNTGVVTAKEVGSVIITAAVAATSNYNAVSATCIVSVGLAAPKISSVTQSKTSITVKWSKVNGAKGYYVYRSTSKSGTYTKIKTISSGSTVSYKDTASKTSGKTYYYKVYAYSGSTKSSASSAKSIVYMKGTVSSLTNTSSGITVKWSKVSGATGYKIYRKSSSASGYSLVKTITKASTTSYTDTKVKSNNGTTYTYYVQPYNSLSKGAYATKKTVRLTAVSISSLKNTASKTLTVKYKKNSKATGYQIQYSTSSTFASSKTKSVSVTKASTLSKKLTKLTKGKKYYVRIRAYKKVSDTKYYSAWSTKKSAKVSK